MSIEVVTGDCRTVLGQMPAESVQACVTSPPYWCLRDYGVDGQIGLESSPDAFVAELVEVFRAVRRVLRDDGTLWLNLGDSYAGAPGGYQGKNGTRADRTQAPRVTATKGGDGLKPKDLVGIPWMVAFALRADGWYLRSEIIWHKPNPIPESVRDRSSRCHEQIFLLAKSRTYYFDGEAVRTPLKDKMATTWGSPPRRSKGTDALGSVAADNIARSIPNRRPRIGEDGKPTGANIRSVWEIASQPFDGAHFATFPPRLVEPCVLAGSRVGDMVLDPFAGAGTTGVVARSLGRSFVGVELNPEYAEMARTRIARTQPGLPFINQEEPEA